MHRVLFRSQLLPVKGACDYCQCCRALYGTQEGFLGCMHFFGEELSLWQMLAAACRSTLSLLPKPSAGCETSWTCTCHPTHSIRAPPHSALLLCTSYSCTQTYLHLTDVMLCNQTVGAHLGDLSASRCHASHADLLPSCTYADALPETPFTAHAPLANCMIELLCALVDVRYAVQHFLWHSM